MEFQTVRALRGPNVWAKTAVLEVLLDIQQFPHRHPQEIAGFLDRLRAWIPTLDGPNCASNACERTVELSGNGAGWAQVVERVTCELQRLAGSGTGFSRTYETSQSGLYQVLIGFTEEPVVRGALEAARACCRAALEGGSYDVAAEVDLLRSLDQQIRLGPSTGSIVRAAEARGIPTRRLNEGSLVQLGFGARQHRILAAETDRTSAIAETIAQDKELTKTLLRAIGVPVPEGRPVENADDAWEAAEDIGTPVVVKPQYGNHGRGVAVNLTTREQILAAYDAAKDEGTSVIVERFAPGSDHRMFVVGDRLIAAARREPPQVTGNGRDTIAELVEEINRDPRRGEDHATPLSKLCLDAIALSVLAEGGLTPESVLPEGQVVAIRRNANLSTGGSAVDVTDIVHPEVAARAVMRPGLWGWTSQGSMSWPSMSAGRWKSRGA